MRYIAGKTDKTDPCLQDADWQNAVAGQVAVENWQGFCAAPKTEFWILRGANGISVRMHTEETALRAVCTEENDRVCDDSCMEFFLQPDLDDPNYLNFELNPNGVMFLSIGTGRHGRTLITEREALRVVSVARDGDWTIKFYIPDCFLKQYFSKIDSVCRGNFYKCGELTGHSHFASWTTIQALEPDFHRPEYFAEIVL